MRKKVHEKVSGSFSTSLSMGLLLLLVGQAPGLAQEEVREPVDFLKLTRTMVGLQQEGRYAEALPMARQLTTLAEEEFGPEHPTVAIYLDNLAVLYHAVGETKKSEVLFQRAWTIQENTLGPDHLAVATTLNHMGALYHTMGEDSHATALLERAATLRERHLGPDHSATVAVLSNLAILLEATGEYDEAEPLFQRILLTQEYQAGRTHPSMGRALESYARLLRKTNRPVDAAAVEARAQALGTES